MEVHLRPCNKDEKDVALVAYARTAAPTRNAQRLVRSNCMEIKGFRIYKNGDSLL